ncbi:ECF RNA polymerase sigma factor SigW [Anatilimnocola aggregata]|uniref:ECF RNA polymerase sigma factor SigW n=1 Tax=Anatilimnocola aggregata TaxID=2528021 RepID=A0A517Y7E1_9BACT|nr:RNA polymerase sigma factor [Anatilimnocola aggregata]QDU26138.1 ECF RNA polymerase sigma factor SigW [Anatilimnocola aggregata]
MDNLSQPLTADELLASWVREHSAAVRGYALALVRRPDVADDVLQEVFRRAWQVRDSFRQQGQDRAFLIRIADHLVCDRARKLGWELNLDESGWQGHEPADEADPVSIAEWREAEQDLAVALEQLSAGQRRVLLMRYFGGLEFAEIAEQMSCPLNTALSHCRRGLQALRRLLVHHQP